MGTNNNYWTLIIVESIKEQTHHENIEQAMRILL